MRVRAGGLRADIRRWHPRGRAHVHMLRTRPQGCRVLLAALPGQGRGRPRHERAATTHRMTMERHSSLNLSMPMARMSARPLSSVCVCVCVCVCLQSLERHTRCMGLSIRMCGGCSVGRAGCAERLACASGGRRQSRECVWVCVRAWVSASCCQGLGLLSSEGRVRQGRAAGDMKGDGGWGPPFPP
jgi:hypothetical protein